MNGRTQTHLPWPGFAPFYPNGEWHHDLLHADGTPYDAQEIAEFRHWCAVAARTPRAAATDTTHGDDALE